MSQSERDRAEDAAEQESVGAVAKQLGERFDAVVVMASRHDGQGTRTVIKGSGNWHTRLGLAVEFMEATRQQIREEAKELFHKE